MVGGIGPIWRAMPAEQRLTWRRRLFAFVVASVGAAAAAAVSFAMTVYDAAHPKPVPVVAPGQPIDTGGWTITFHDARTGSIPPTGVKPSTPKTLVMIEFDLDNRSASTSNIFSRRPPSISRVTNLWRAACSPTCRSA